MLKANAKYQMLTASSQELKAKFRTVRKDTIKASLDVATSFYNCLPSLRKIC